MATPEQRLQILRDLGFTGQRGNGAAANFLDATPGLRDEYEARSSAIDAGYSGPFAGTNFDQGGVSPVGVVEPLTDWQKQGLTGLATYSPQVGASPFLPTMQTAYSNAVNAASNIPVNQMFGRAQGFYDQAGNQLTAGTAGITDADISKYMNPYTQQVTDRTIAQINDQAGINRARLNASQAGRRSFGDSSSAIQLSQLDKNTLGQVADTTANLNYQGYNSALNQVNQDRARNLQGAGIYGNLASDNMGQGYQGLSQLGNLVNIGGNANNAFLSDYDYRRGDQERTYKNQIGAGAAVQDQNQRLLDAVQNEYGRMQGYDKSQLSDLAQFLSAFQSQQSTGASAGDQSAIGKMATGALGGLGLYMGGTR